MRYAFPWKYIFAFAIKDVLSFIKSKDSIGRGVAGWIWPLQPYPHQSLRVPMLSMSDVDASYAIAIS